MLMAGAANSIVSQCKLPRIQRQSWLFQYISVFLGESIQGIKPNFQRDGACLYKPPLKRTQF